MNGGVEWHSVFIFCNYSVKVQKIDQKSRERNYCYYWLVPKGSKNACVGTST